MIRFTHALPKTRLRQDHAPGSFATSPRARRRRATRRRSRISASSRACARARVGIVGRRSRGRDHARPAATPNPRFTPAATCRFHYAQRRIVAGTSPSPHPRLPRVTLPIATRRRGGRGRRTTRSRPREREQLADGRPFSFLRVTRPELELEPGTSSDDPAAHATARRNLEMLERESILRREDRPHVLLYRLVMRGHRQIGVVCCCEVGQYEEGTIVRHERTRVDKELERTHHFEACDAHTEPVFLAHRDDAALDELVRRDVNDRPHFHFVAPDGITHTMWTVPDPDEYVDAFRRLPKAYICDGHHRVAAAAALARARRETGASRSAEAQRFLAVIFPLSHLRIMPYNRIVKDLHGLSPEQLMRRLRGVGQVEPTSAAEPCQRGQFGIYVGGRWWTLTVDPVVAQTTDPVAALDVSVLQRLVLEPIFGIADPRRDPRLDFVGGIRGTDSLERAVDSGEAGAAFALHPTSMHELLEVADAGGIMPPKSTWFEPKLRSGLVVHPF
ncbi:MAG: DUF1015 family protein [Phycisphaerales bacterium]